MFAPTLPDPRALAARQRELDAARLQGRPELAQHKFARMAASPLAFLRGSAPLFYEILAACPALDVGPDAQGWLVGDLHVENFGVYRPGIIEGADDTKAVFDLNDFDDAVIGRQRLDALRLTVSMLLGLRDLGLGGGDRLALAQSLLDAWAAARSAKKPAACEPPRCVAALIKKVSGRSRKELLDGRTKGKGDERHFVRGDRYQDLPPTMAAKAKAAFAQYVAQLPPELLHDGKAFDVLDVAARVAGTGSLGVLRVAVLTRGKGGSDGAFVFDMKEEGEPSAVALLGAKAGEGEPAARTLSAIRAMLDHPPKMVGTTKIDDLTLLVRRLAPQEDRLEWNTLQKSELRDVATFLGTLAGAAHARGGKGATPTITKADGTALLASAIALAGLHESIYLAFCQR